jgi:RNA ligase (TIGR02306 family)
MRKLVRIVKVDGVEEIKDAHSVEIVKIGGWRCVTGKGQFKRGDYGVFFEIDSMLPVIGKYSFLEGKVALKSMDNLVGYVIRTRRMFNGEVISQGLLMPISEYPEIKSPEVDMDVTELLGVRLYEPPENLRDGGEARAGGWPPYLPRTDEERVQNINLARYEDDLYEVTTKIDGASCTAYLLDDVFGVCGRNVNFSIEPGKNENTNMVVVARRLNLESVMRDLNLNGYALQMELAGPKVNFNRQGLHSYKFFLHKVWNHKEQRYLSAAERNKVYMDIWNLLAKDTNSAFNHVPVVAVNFSIKGMSMDDIIKMADGEFNNSPREGIVFKALDGSKSFKAISNEYLLKWHL